MTDVTTSVRLQTDTHTAEIPPPTAISTMQQIGVQLCAIPAEELTEEALNGTVAEPPSPTT